MYIVKNLPVFLSLTACVIITILGINDKIDYEELSLKLVIAIISFYLFGTFVRNLIIKFLIKALVISEKKARLIKESKALAGLSHTFSETETKSNNHGYNTSSSSNDELEPYMPQKY